MAVSGLPILSSLRTRMQWHQERQRLLAENVANADTPQFKPRDLSPIEPNRPLQGASVQLVRTSTAHQTATSETTTFPTDSRGAFQIRPAGNAVNLEDEMLKVSSNQMDFQAAASLYSRSLGILKMAFGKRA